MRSNKNRETPNNQVNRAPQESDRLGFSTTRVILRGKFTEEVPSAERAYLKVLKEDGQNEVFELRSLSGTDVIIGRTPDCTIRLTVDSVSRKHARVTLRNDEYHIEDMNSTNGVYVNGVKVVKCVLRDSDQIEIGGIKIIFNEEKTLKAK